MRVASAARVACRRSDRAPPSGGSAARVDAASGRPAGRAACGCGNRPCAACRRSVFSPSAGHGVGAVGHPSSASGRTRTVWTGDLTGTCGTGRASCVAGIRGVPGVVAGPGGVTIAGTGWAGLVEVRSNGEVPVTGAWRPASGPGPGTPVSGSHSGCGVGRVSGGGVGPAGRGISGAASTARCSAAPQPPGADRGPTGTGTGRLTGAAPVGTGTGTPGAGPVVHGGLAVQLPGAAGAVTLARAGMRPRTGGGKVTPAGRLAGTVSGPGGGAGTVELVGQSGPVAGHPAGTGAAMTARPSASTPGGAVGGPAVSTPVRGSAGPGPAVGRGVTPVDAIRSAGATGTVSRPGTGCGGPASERISRTPVI